VEVENPGILLPGLTVEELRDGVSRVRNRVLARVFKELGLIEQWGTGVQRMFRQQDDTPVGWTSRRRGSYDRRYRSRATRAGLTARVSASAKDATRLSACPRSAELRAFATRRRSSVLP
jgi:hypothetical protein